MTDCFGDFGLFFGLRDGSKFWGFYYSLGSNLMMTCIQSLLFSTLVSQTNSHSSSPFIFFSKSLSKRPKERVFRCVTLPDAHFQQCQVFDQAHHIKNMLKSCFDMSVVIFICLISTCFCLFLWPYQKVLL